MRRRRGTRRGTHPEAGVTLIEMMVVLVIIAVVAAMIVPNVMGRPDDARMTVAQTDIRAIASALELYRLDNQGYPTSTQGLEALVTKPVAPPEPTNWVAGGYLNELPLDPWGNDYFYRWEQGDVAFELVSYGADGEPGGSGNNADVQHAGRESARN